MYENYYGLLEKPFTLTPDPSFLFLGRHHRKVLTLLQYALAHATGFALVTGEIGSGKTTLVRHLLTLTDRSVHVGLLSHTHPGFTSLLPWLAQCVGVSAQGVSEPELHRAFVEELFKRYCAGSRTVIIVDEAQNLSEAALEELRTLSNVNADKDMVLQTILVGQPELRARLARPSMAQFAQRIAIDYHLGTLDLHESREYVRHRLRVAGAQSNLFDEEAIDLAHAGAAGVPRLINQICDLALVYGFSDQRATIGADLVAQVLSDRGAGGILPLQNLALTRSA
jgi:type II secretory pathway predicted ATPase ExeA